MDVKKLIERLRTESLYKDKATLFGILRQRKMHPGRSARQESKLA